MKWIVLFLLLPTCFASAQNIHYADSDTVEIYANNNDLYGAVGNTIFTATDPTDIEWKYAFTLPFAVDAPNQIIINNNRLLYATKDSLYYYNIPQHTATITTRQALLADFCKHAITRVSFSTGYSNCDGNGSDAIIYNTRNKREFVLSKIDTGKIQYPSTKLKAEKTTINKKNVTKFLNEICLHYDKQPVLKDIGFTENDYQQCKTDIKNAQHTKYRNFQQKGFYFDKKNLNYDRLITLVDSIKNMDSITLNHALSHLDSKTLNLTYWITAGFTNDVGSRLSISCQYFEPNALYIPWELNIDDAVVIATAPAILSFFKDNCPSLLAEQNKVPILYELVKYLY